MAEEFDNPNDELEVDLGPDAGIEVEIVDDTPEEDRGRTPLETDEDTDQEAELNAVTKASDAKRRINQLTHKYHDERREKERLAREHAEAIRIAQTFKGRIDELEQTLNWGHQEWSKEGTGRIETAQKLAQDKYRRAFESGDTDGVIEAQAELIELANQKARYENTAPPVSQPLPNALQTPAQPVYNNENVAPQQPAPRDYRAEDWASRNTWFGKDAKMTAYAYGVHEDLVQNQGFDPTSDEYYQAIDSEIRQRFPEKFNRQKTSSPVAPVARSTAPKTVRLTSSEAAIAKKLGLTPEQYAREKTKGATING